MPDSSRAMDLSSPKAACALHVIEKLTSAGFKALFAGGCVRDHLLGTIPTDYDIATSATPDEVEKIFSKTIPVGKQFGVMLVLLKQFQFEVATFRTEGGYQDGRRPGFVKFADSEEDALRRDFTVNGLFYNPLEARVLDYVGGQEDIKKRVIRCIGNPAERFEEDKLRLLRAVRFAARLDFEIEPATWTEVKGRARQIEGVSYERIRDEVDKIFTSQNALKGIQLLIEGGFWAVLWPGIDSEPVLKRYDSLAGRPMDVSLANAICYLEQERPLIIAALKKFRYSNETIQATLRILEIVEQFQRLNTLRPGEVRLLAHDKYTSQALVLCSLILPDVRPIQAGLNGWMNQGLPKRFLSGDDLKAAGIPQGPQMGKLLEEAYLLQLENVFQDKQAAMTWVLRQTGRHNKQE